MPPFKKRPKRTGTKKDILQKKVVKFLEETCKEGEKIEYLISDLREFIDFNCDVHYAVESCQALKWEHEEINVFMKKMSNYTDKWFISYDRRAK